MVKQSNKRHVFHQNQFPACWRQNQNPNNRKLEASQFFSKETKYGSGGGRKKREALQFFRKKTKYGSGGGSKRTKGFWWDLRLNNFTQHIEQLFFPFSIRVVKQSRERTKPSWKKTKNGRCIGRNSNSGKQQQFFRKETKHGSGGGRKRTKGFWWDLLHQRGYNFFCIPLSSLILLVVVRTRLTCSHPSSWIRLAISKGSQSTQLTVFSWLGMVKMPDSPCWDCGD